MTKLSDTQRVLLSSASQREDGNVLPLPDALAAAGKRLDKSLADLLSRELIAELETSKPEAIHRRDGDIGYGLFLTAAGAAAIGVSADDGEDESAGEALDDRAGESACGGKLDASPEPAPAPSPNRTTKAASVVALLERSDGVTLSELIAATGWLPHTTRAALTGLRKKGHTIERTKREDATCYRIVVVG